MQRPAFRHRARLSITQRPGRDSMTRREPTGRAPRPSAIIVSCSQPPRPSTQVQDLVTQVLAEAGPLGGPQQERYFREILTTVAPAHARQRLDRGSQDHQHRAQGDASVVQGLRAVSSHPEGQHLRVGAHQGDGDGSTSRRRNSPSASARTATCCSPVPVAASCAPARRARVASAASGSTSACPGSRAPTSSSTATRS